MGLTVGGSRIGASFFIGFRGVESALQRGSPGETDMDHPRRFWAWPFAACGFLLTAALCVAADFNPFAWAWGLLLELARAVGGKG